MLVKFSKSKLNGNIKKSTAIYLKNYTNLTTSEEMHMNIGVVETSYKLSTSNLPPHICSFLI